MKGTYDFAYQCPECGDCDWKETTLCLFCGAIGAFKKVVVKKLRHSFRFKPWTWKHHWRVNVYDIPAPGVVEKKKAKRK